MAHATKSAATIDAARFQRTNRMHVSRVPKLSSAFVAATRAMNRTGSSRTSVRCSAEQNFQENSLLNELTQGLRMTYNMMDSKTRATALQNDALLVGRREDAARIEQLLESESILKASLARLAATVAKQAATISEQAASLAQQASAPSSSTQTLRLPYEMMESRLKGAAVQNSALMAARRQDAVSMQQFSENEIKLRATVAEQAAAIQQHTTLATHTGRHLKILTRLVSKLRSKRKLKANELEHATVNSHVEALQEEKTGLQKTLEETEARLTQQERAREYAWSEAQPRGRKRQEMQEAKEEAEYLGRQMHEKWIKALTEIELLKASMISGHFLFEALMKAPLIVDNSPLAQEQTTAVAQEDMYL